MELKFKGKLPIVSLTKKEYEENKDLYYSVKDVDNSLGVVYTTNNGEFLPNNALFNFINTSAAAEMQREYDKLEKKYTNLSIDYDALNRKYQLAIQKIVEMEK